MTSFTTLYLLFYNYTFFRFNVQHLLFTGEINRKHTQHLDREKTKTKDKEHTATREKHQEDTMAR